MGAPAGYPIEAVDNAMRALLLLRDQPSVRVGEIATLLNIARSSAHRLLTTLQARDILKQDPASKAFGPGPALLELGAIVLGSSDVRTRTRQLVEACAERTNETVHLCDLEGTDLFFIDGIEGVQVIRAALRTGQRLPAHRTAAGRAMLALLPNSEIQRLYPSSHLTDGTSLSMLTAELGATRSRGYGVNLADSEAGLHAVGVALRDRQGAPRAGISISGPAFRLGPDRLAHLGRLVAALAHGVLI